MAQFSKKLSKKARVQQFVRDCGWDRVGRAEWKTLREHFAQTSESTVRDALAELPVPVEQPFAGVGTKTLEELERSLIAMAASYPSARRECREVVIAAKDRTRFAAGNAKATPEKRALKAEMVEWMLVWLGDPAMFPAWVELRKRARLLQQVTAGQVIPPE